jgi:hypothetical protein
MLFYSYRNSDEHKCKLGPTPEQNKHEEELRALLNQISRNRIRNGVYMTGCLEAFDKYKAEHGMYSRRCAHENHDREEKEEEEEEHDEKRDTEHIIPINARGNICGDVPMLSLVNRQLFQDTFYPYFSELREGMWFRWTIRNLDFFPFLRFMQNLRQPPYPIEILPAQMHMKYDDTDEGRDRVLHKRKFEHVKRLIDLHWLQGFPLWGCLTSMCDTRCYNSPLGELLYSVRQIVALYRVQHDAWQKWSIEFLQACERAESELNECEDAHNYRELPAAELVEQVIDRLCKVIEYILGYERTFPPLGGNETKWDKDILKTFRYKRAHKKVAYSVEHAVVNCLHQYRRAVDSKFRGLLSEDAYAEWEALPDRGTTGQIPEGIVL